MNAKLNLDAAASAALTQTPEPAPVRAAGGQESVPSEYRAKVQAAAEKFEGFFIAQMLRQMRQGTREMAGEESIYDSRVNQDMLDMADTALADSLAGQRAFGIADAILRQLLPAPAAAPSLKESTAPVASSD